MYTQFHTSSASLNTVETHMDALRHVPIALRETEEIMEMYH